MGGLGSGRHPTKSLVEDHRVLDVLALYRRGWLRPGMQGKWCWQREGREVASLGWTVYGDEGDLALRGEEGDLALGITLNYRVTLPGGSTEEVRYTVPVDWSRCHFGGWRPYFICPNIHCGRRATCLYGRGSYFLCRHCQDLVYVSQRMDQPTRRRRKAQKIRLGLSGTAPQVEGFPPKPKRMHWKTYWRLRQKGESV